MCTCLGSSQLSLSSTLTEASSPLLLRGLEDRAVLYKPEGLLGPESRRAGLNLTYLAIIVSESYKGGCQVHP